MSDSRDAAHQSMRKLWEAVEKRLREPDVVERTVGNIVVREVETDLGAKLCSYAGAVSVKAEFEKPDGTDETFEVDFAEDIRDLSESEVRIDWIKHDGAGTNTPPLRDFPGIAKELLALV